MKQRAALIAVLAALAVGLAACGKSSSSSSTTSSSPASTSTATISNTKAKFVLHAGLAFGAFHRWIYKPAKSGELAHPLEHKLTAVKAAAAAVFVYHELGLALKDAQADATLSKLVSPITALQNKIHGIGSGGTSAANAESLNGTVSSIKSQAQSA
ncbi:MAG: hypothetical protein JO244_00975, partial [Solirubrobacterales bacterium]|nr:hypothetical protein [Solirubrobacterales bacterium]